MTGSGVGDTTEGCSYNGPPAAGGTINCQMFPAVAEAVTAGVWVEVPSTIDCGVTDVPGRLAPMMNSQSSTISATMPPAKSRISESLGDLIRNGQRLPGR